MARKTIFNPTGENRVTSLPSIFNLPTEKPAPKPVRGITIRKGGGALQNTVPIRPAARRGTQRAPARVTRRRTVSRGPTLQDRLDDFAARNRRTITTYKKPPEPYTPEATKQAVFEALSGLQQEYDVKYAEAKGANEARYQQLLSIADQTTGQRAADIRAGAFEEEADVMRRLSSLGMSGTTVAPTLRGGIRSRMEASLDRLADTMQQTKLGIIERRQDPYPDRSEITNLVASIGTGHKGDLLPATMGALSGSGFRGGAPAGANTSLSAAQYRSKYGVA